ncbi:Hypothetical_protein [Hexamita inflata]|uniref:Hypothetical_protein n=1 Tax=Hexamita inflata TaxID=28002 RepID=A0AA86TM33_9EUKA|nr:Hypothetical protein HINF_LOCUS10394 [Hexamita inflata]
MRSGQGAEWFHATTFVKKQKVGAHADSKLFANFPPHYVRKSPNLRDDRQIFLNIAFTGTRNADIKDANNAFYGFKNTGGCSLTRIARYSPIRIFVFDVFITFMNIQFIVFKILSLVFLTLVYNRVNQKQLLYK